MSACPQWCGWEKNVQTKMSQEFGCILSALHHDPMLKLTETVTSLLLTLIHGFIRFGEYDNMPFWVWKMCEKYNPDLCVVCCEVFLSPRRSLMEDLAFGFKTMLCSTLTWRRK